MLSISSRAQSDIKRVRPEEIYAADKMEEQINAIGMRKIKNVSQGTLNAHKINGNQKV